MDRLWVKNPLYFVTTCTAGRRPILNQPNVAAILVAEWQGAIERHGWQVGRYVMMPDHVHFFCATHREGKSLPAFVGKWKEWTSKRLDRELQITPPVWQGEFFDHVLRSAESYSAKWDYVRNNPVRAGLVESSESWPYQGCVHFR